MSRFALKTPYLIVVGCLAVSLLGIVSIARMPIDMFPSMNIPVVAVATFYSGMPPEQIESDITYHLERFFTLASGIEHIESRSLSGVSLIKVYFQPSANPDAAASAIANLAMADMKDLPPGTLPPVILKLDASTLPVCLVTFQGDGLSETQMKDLAQNVVRNQLAAVPGASVPQPFGGRWRQITVNLDPHKLEAYQLSPMDVVRAISDANVILPAGDAQIGRLDYNIYANSQLADVADIDRTPLKLVGQSPVRVEDVGQAKDSYAPQYNLVRIDGQRSVYLPVLKQGGDSNTIAIVDGTREVLKHLFDVPKSLVNRAIFDQSKFVKTAIGTLLHEGGIGLFLTCLMILVFLGSFRATLAVCFSIPLSVLTTMLALQLSGGSINSMVLGGLALALSRLIDNSVVVLENIYRHLELGEAPAIAADQGGREVALPVLAATLTTIVVFFPVTLLYGVSKFLFTALAAAVVISLIASYVVAMTVVPLFCARFIQRPGHIDDIAASFHEGRRRWPRFEAAARFNVWFALRFEQLSEAYQRLVARVIARPRATLGTLLRIGFALTAVLLVPLLGLSFFPRTDAGQFVISVKAPSGSNLTATEAEVTRVEQLIRDTVAPADLGLILSNIGLDPGFSAVFSPNAAMHTAFVQVSLADGHRTGSFAYIDRLQHRLATELPELSTFFSSGSLVDAVVNLGMPAPIDLQVGGSDIRADHAAALDLAERIRREPSVAEVFVPQDLDYPSLKLDVDRVHAGELGLSEKEVVTNVVTALDTNQMIAPIVWNDPANGNNYYINVQYPEHQVQSLGDLSAIPLHGPRSADSTRLDMVGKLTRFEAPDRGRSPTDPPRDGRLRPPQGRGPGRSRHHGRPDRRRDEAFGWH